MAERLRRVVTDELTAALERHGFTVRDVVTKARAPRR